MEIFNLYKWNYTSNLFTIYFPYFDYYFLCQYIVDLFSLVIAKLPFYF